MIKPCKIFFTSEFNTGYSNTGLIHNISGKVIANFWLDKIYSKEGLNEMIRNFTCNKFDITSNECLALASKMLEFVRNQIQRFQRETGNMYNLEASPAGALRIVLPKKKKIYLG